METPRLVFRNARVCPMADGIDVIQPGAVVCTGYRIAWVGPERDLRSEPGDAEIECGGRLLTPGLVDCHTHLVYDGNRANEFEMRLAGATYEEIARAGGGIMSSVAATEQEFAFQQPARWRIPPTISPSIAVSTTLSTRVLPRSR
jgi:imidazolonepropionase